MTDRWTTNSNAVYHAGPEVSSSRLKLMIGQTPAHARWDMDNPRKETKDKRVGNVTHTATLEPEQLEKRLLLEPDVNKRTKDGKAELAKWYETVPANALVVDQKELDTAKAMRDAVWAHPEASELLSGCVMEQSGYAELDYNGHTIIGKIRPDARNRAAGYIADLKTTKNAHPKWFSKDRANYMYHLSAVWYLQGANAIDGAGSYREWYWICVEKTGNHQVAVYRLSDRMYELGAELVDRAFNAYSECLVSGEWPGYTGITDLEPEYWEK